MTKNEIIEAINATIASNGQKAITAESLANILIEMVNATPEGGSSSGGSGVMYLQFGYSDDGSSDMTFTDAQKANNAAIYETFNRIADEGAAFPPLFIDGYPCVLNGFESDDSGVTAKIIFLVAFTMISGELDENIGAFPLYGMIMGVILYPDGTFEMVLEE